MIKLIVSREYDYVLKSEKGKENPTVFKLKTLTPEDMLRIEDESFDYDVQRAKSKVKIGSSVMKRVEVGLISWNIPDKPCTIENKRLLPIEVIKELSSEIVDTSYLKEEEIKN